MEPREASMPIVRLVNENDFDNVYQLFHQLWPDKKIDKDSLHAVFDAMLSNNSYAMICAELQEKIIAFASLSIQHNFWEEGLILYITTMIVDEKYRNRGVGAALLKAIEATAGERRCKRIELESAFHRTSAHAFYEKNGFVKRAYFFSKETKSV